MRALQVITVMRSALTMGLALAHALEHPRKMRLNRDEYLAVQTIYYPGFTVGGFGEPLSVLAALALVFMTPHSARSFWWSVAGFIGLAIVHAIFWTVTQPVNRYWTAIRKPNGPPLDQWKRFRERWEHSHVIRAVFAAASLICISVALVVGQDSGG